MNQTQTSWNISANPAIRFLGSVCKFRHDPYDELVAKTFYGLTAYPTTPKKRNPVVANSSPSPKKEKKWEGTLPPEYIFSEVAGSCEDVKISSSGYVERFSLSGTFQHQKGTVSPLPTSNLSCGCNAAADDEDGFSSVKDDESLGLSSLSGQQMSSPLPPGTIHQELLGKVNFFPYPETAFRNVEPPKDISKSDMTRMFIGQLPYQVAEMQLGWIAYMFGGGVDLYHFEQIVRVDKRKSARASREGKPPKKMPTGCYHVYVLPDQVSLLTHGLHKRVLLDDTGVWYCDGQTRAEVREQELVLEEYCHIIKEESLAAQQAAAEIKKKRKDTRNKEQQQEPLSIEENEELTAGASTTPLPTVSRVPSGRPLSSIVVQVATSTYDPASAAVVVNPSPNVEEVHDE